MSSDPPSGGPSPQPDPAALLSERGTALLEALSTHAPRSREDAQAAATYAFAAGVELGFKRSHCELVRELARLSGIGLVYVPVAVLDKPAAERDADETRAFDAHHEAGYGLAIGAGIPERESGWLLRVRERWDGSGPDKLAGEAIPIESRIVRAAAACREALASQPDVEGMRPHQSAAQALTLQAGEQLDPRVADALVSVLERAGDFDRV